MKVRRSVFYSQTTSVFQGQLDKVGKNNVHVCFAAEEMSQLESSSSAVHHQDGEGGEAVDGPQRKLLKLDLGTRQSECEVAASKVKIEDLPDEVIVMILSYYKFSELVEVAQNVCTQWRRASHDPLLWRNKEYCVGEDETDAEVLAILPRVPQLRKLVIDRQVKVAVIQAVCKNCKQLNYLDIGRLTRIKLYLLKKLVASCRNIKSIKISAELLHDENGAIVLSRLNLLNSLTVFGPTAKTIHLGPLAKGCPVLSKLKLGRVDHICTEDLTQLIEVKRKTLSHLELPWTGNNNRCLVPLLMSCTALVKLELYPASNSSGELMQFFPTLGQLPNLRSLGLCFGFQEVPAHTFKSGGLLHLEVLKIEDVCNHNSILVAISEGCPNLRYLHLRGCLGHGEEVLKELHRFKKLQTLTVRACTVLHEAALHHMSQVPGLRKLLLELCNFRRQKGGLAAILRIHTLEILSFRHIEFLDYFPFSQIPKTLTNLRVLSVVECRPLEKAVLKKLKNQMPGLQIYARYVAGRNFLNKMERIMRL